MKDLEKYIRESIFDVWDNIENVDVEMWVTRFENSSNLQKTIEEFINTVIMDGAYKTTSPKLKGDEIFIRYVFNKPGDIYEYLIQFYWPESNKMWRQFLIVKKGHEKKVKFENYSQSLVSKAKYCDMVLNKNVIVLPQKYIKLIDRLCERYK